LGDQLLLSSCGENEGREVDQVENKGLQPLAQMRGGLFRQDIRHVNIFIANGALVGSRIFYRHRADLASL